MATKEQIAEMNRKLGLSAEASAFNRGAERLSRGIWKAPSVIASQPVAGARNLLGSMLFGPKNRNPLSPLHGHRRTAVTGDNRFAQISKEEFKAIKEGKQKGRAFSAKSGPLGTAHFKQRYAPGGLVGFAQKHPLMATGAGLLAYYLATNQGARQGVGAMASGMTPQLQSAPTAAVQKSWEQPSFQNPLANDVWGK